MDSASNRYDRAFRVGDWRVEPLRLVVVDDAERETPLSQRAMSVLVELARAGGNVVRKYDLMRAVWGDAEVSDGALSQAVFELRHAFRDDTHHPAFIETIRGVGFRLVPPVCTASDDAGGGSGRTRSMVRPGALAGLVFIAALAAYLAVRPYNDPPALPAVKSIAVLPFENRSDREADLYFTDGIHDDLLRHLSYIRDIKTISRTSVMAYRGKPKNIRTIGRELNVATILEGGVQRAGDEVRVNVKLIEADTDAQLWSKAYTHKLTAENLFAIQSEIARDVAHSLKAILTPEEQQRLERVPTSNLEALYAYFKGRDARNLGTHEAIDRSVAQFRRATELDATFAEAHADLAYTLLLQILFSGLPVDAQAARARPHIDRALELDPHLARAFVAKGHLHEVKRELELAGEAYAQALELNPGSVIALRSYGDLLHWSSGRPADAVPYFERALESVPGAPGIRQQLAEALVGSGRDEQGEAMIRGVIEENPDNALALFVLGNLLSRNQGRIDEAIQAYRAALAADPGGWLYAANIAAAYEMLGDGPEVARWLEYAIANVPDSENVPAFRTIALQARGDTQGALRSFRDVRIESDLFRDLQPRIAWSLHSGGETKAALDLILAASPRFDSAEPVVEPYQLPGAAYAVHFLVLEGRREQAERLAETALEQAELMPRASHFGRNWWPAAIRMALGDAAGAVRELEHFVAAGGLNAFLIESELWQPLHDNRQYQRMRREVGERIAAQRKRLAEMEQNGELASIPPPGPGSAD